MRWTSLAAGIGCVVALFATPLAAAEIANVKDAHCEITLSGEIQDGDAAKLRKAIDRSGVRRYHTPNDGTVRLCLNSPGGSYPAALKLIDVIIEAALVPTVIKRGNECYSACALVFLAGSYWPDSAEGEVLLLPRRTLFPGGKLGFHAPYSEGFGGRTASKKTIENALKVGVDSIVDLMDRNKFGLFPDSLLRKALRVSSDKMLEVKTVADATRWNIEVPQQIALPHIDKAAALRVCKNAFDASDMRVDKLYSSKTGKDAEGIDEFALVYIRADGEARCNVSYSGSPDKLSISVSLDEQYIAGSNWLYLLDPATRIDSLQSGSKSATAATNPPGKKLAKGTPNIYRNYDFSGDDIGTVDARSADACATQCARNGTCTAFSYNRWAKKCFLKSSIDSARFEPRSVSGNLTGTYKTGSKPDTVQNFRGRKFKDKPLRVVSSASFEDCLAACLKDGTCIAINFHKAKRQCHFFSVVNEYFPDAEYDAAMRWETP